MFKPAGIVGTKDAANCDCCVPPCGGQTDSGGVGVTAKEFAMPSKEGAVEFTYDAYGVPDSFKVEGGGQVFVDTGMVAGSKTIRFCKPAGVTKIKVTVTGFPCPDPNIPCTAWTYYLGCPDAPCQGATTVVDNKSGLDHEPDATELAAEVARQNLLHHPNHNPLP
jgi:hypothetical protein